MLEIVSAFTYVSTLLNKSQETDKSTIDVEAQDDSIVSKIMVRFPEDLTLSLIQLPGPRRRAIPVGKIIALLAQDGDDIPNLQVSAEASSSPKQQKLPPSPEPHPRLRNATCHTPMGTYKAPKHEAKPTPVKEEQKVCPINSSRFSF